MFKAEGLYSDKDFEYIRKDCEVNGIECKKIIHYMRCVYDSTIQSAFYNLIGYKIDSMDSAKKLSQEDVAMDDLDHVKMIKPWVTFDEALKIARVESIRKFAAEPASFDNEIITEIEKRGLGSEKGFVLKLATIQYFSDMTYKITPAMAVDYGTSIVTDLMLIQNRLRNLGYEVTLAKLVRTIIENFSLCTEDIFILFKNKFKIKELMGDKLVRCSDLTLEQSIIHNMNVAPEDLYKWILFVDDIHSKLDIDQLITSRRIPNREVFFKHKKAYPNQTDEECLKWAFIKSYCRVYKGADEYWVRARCNKCGSYITGTSQQVTDHINKCVFGGV